MTKSIILVLTLLCAGCVSQKALLVNERGQTARCDNWGFGLLGAPVALIEHNECVKRAKAAGYSDVPKTHE